MSPQSSILSTTPKIRTETPRSVLSFRSVSKCFGSVRANDSISFDVESGGIHAIVGENGAGKSTLTKILYGYYGPDSGAIYLNDVEIELKTPSEARKTGIGMVHQQLALVPSLTGFENVVLGDPTLRFAFARRQLEKRVTARARELGFNFDLSCPVSNLSIAERQKLEIFKLLWRDARVLILDEPTSQLTPFEAEDILTLIAGLADAGRIVILITHHITEVMNFARRITVLKKGKCVKTMDTKSITDDDLAKLMVDSGEFAPDKSRSVQTEQPLITLQDLSAGSSATNHAIHQIDLDLHAGEIVGVAGISGSGQTELGQVIAGLLRSTTGQISFRNKTVAQRDAVCYIPSDQKLAIAPALSVAANGFLKSVNAPWWKAFSFLKGSTIDQQAEQFINSFQITPALSDVPANALSGGNLQRLIIARELATQATIVVADNPCAGLDASSSSRVRRELRAAADTGRGVILISPDLEELITTCDRIVVMFNGRIVGEQKAGQFDYQSLALMMGGKI